MRLKRPNSAVAVVASLVVSVSACLGISPIALAQSQLANMGPTETRMPNTASVRYDTQYKSSNEGVIAFDDGQVTRIQLPPGTLVPAFFAVRAQGDVLLTPKQSATYFVVDGVHSKLNLVWANNKQVAITYMGTVTTERMGTAAAFGAAAPKSVHASAAKPADVALPVKAMSNDAALAVPSLAIAEVGGSTANAAASSTNQGQIQAPTAEAAVPVAPVIAKPALTWKVELKDVYIANTLQRWASGQGWRVKWDAAKNFVVEAPDSYVGTFEEAVTELLSAPGIQNSRYPVDVCFYPNTPPLARITLRAEQDKECK